MRDFFDTSVLVAAFLGGHVQELRERLTPIALNEFEYFSAIQKAAERGFTSGRVYDALLLACAAKAKARTI